MRPLKYGAVLFQEPRLLWARPGIDQALHEVTGAVISAGNEPHPGYFAQGETVASLLDSDRDEHAPTRLSCRVCIFSQLHHIQRALDAQPAMMLPAVRAAEEYERISGYTWQQRGSLTVACACSAGVSANASSQAPIAIS